MAIRTPWNPEIIILLSDTVNVMVVMDRLEYSEKIV